MRLRLLVLVIFSFLITLPTTASAHGGHLSPIQTFTQAIGPYSLAITIEMPASVPGPLYLIIQPQGEIGNATIQIQAVPRDFPLTGTPIAEVQTVAGVQLYYSELTADRDGDWELAITINGERGSAHARIPFTIYITPLAPETIPLAIALGSAALLLAISIMIGSIAKQRQQVEPKLFDQLLGYGLFACLIIAGVLGTQQFARQAQGSTTPIYGRPHANATLQTEPVLPAAGKPFTLTIELVDGATGLAVDDLAPHHEALMHLVLIDDIGTAFAHVHPASIAAGRFEVPLVLNQPGDYTAYIEIERQNSGSQIIERRFAMAGQAAAATTDRPGLGPRTIGDLTIDVSSSLEPLTVAKQATFTLSISQAGQPVTDLQPWLGMSGHLIARSADRSIYGHIHAVGAMLDTTNSVAIITPPSYGPDIQFVYTFPQPGEYQLWAQFQYAGQVVTVPIFVEVQG